MKKYLLIAVLLIGVAGVLASSVPVFADETNANNTPGVTNSNSGKIETLKNPLGDVTLMGMINKGLQIFTYLVIIVAVLMLVWVGFQFIWARGNTTKLKELKNWLFYIIIGVALVLGARIIISIVINTLDSTGAVDKEILQGAYNVLK